MTAMIMIFLGVLLGTALYARLQGKIEAMLGCVGASWFVLVVLIFAL